MSDSRLVYSSESGRICPECQKPVSRCGCRKKPSEQTDSIRADGIIRVRRETKGRKGKTVTVLWGFDTAENSLDVVARQLKQYCGSGGSVKAGVLIIQGDHRDKVKHFLEGQGYRVKLTGG